MGAVTRSFFSYLPRTARYSIITEPGRWSRSIFNAELSAPLRRTGWPISYVTALVTSYSMAGSISRSSAVRVVRTASTKYGVRSTDYGLRSTECGLRTTECGVRSAEYGVRSTECGVGRRSGKAEQEARNAWCGERL